MPSCVLVGTQIVVHVLPPSPYLLFSFQLFSGDMEKGAMGIARPIPKASGGKHPLFLLSSLMLSSILFYLKVANFSQ